MQGTEDQSFSHISDQPHVFLKVVSVSAHLQSFSLIVEQPGDVPGNPLHQVLGVVPLDFELTLLFIINLQTEKTESHIGFVKGDAAERLLVLKHLRQEAQCAVCHYSHELCVTAESTLMAALLA